MNATGTSAVCRPALTVGRGPLAAFVEPLRQVADQCRERGESHVEAVFGESLGVLGPYAPFLSSLPGQRVTAERKDSWTDL